MDAIFVIYIPITVYLTTVSLIQAIQQHFWMSNITNTEMARKFWDYNQQLSETEVEITVREISSSLLDNSNHIVTYLVTTQGD
jgi:hypothetical protein